MMKKTVAQEILEDESVKNSLEGIILEKADYLDQLKTKREKFINYPHPCLVENGGKEVVETFYDCLIDEGETKLVERDLTNACYQYAKNIGKLPETTAWEKKYQYATKMASIGRIVEHLLGKSNLRRNIACPFHEDNSPSLKIYEKTNSFYCFGCGSGGGPINFVMLYKNCSFKEAVDFISNL